MSKSGQFNYYKDNFEILDKENKSLKKDNATLKNKNKNLKKKINRLEKTNTKLDNNFNDLKSFIIDRKVAGSDVNLNYCPICGKPNEFLPHGLKQRPRSRCPYCNSLERHRFVYLIFLKKIDDVFNKENAKVLHFAPERVIYNIFISKENIDYYPVDFAPEKYGHIKDIIPVSVNMESIPFDDETFDLVYNSHVLEHVSDDNKAMSELYRVLKKGGVCIVIVPMSKNYETLEKEEYNTPELRLKYYYQEDHLRLYGYDIKDKLESVGFNVEMVTSEDIIPDENDRKLFNITNRRLFICRK